MNTHERLPKSIERELVQQGVIKEEHTMKSFLDEVALDSIAFEQGLKRLASDYDDKEAQYILEKHFNKEG